MDKKAVSIALLIFEVMAVVFVVLAIGNRAAALGSSDTTVKKQIVEDLRMMINTLVGIPGDAIVEYPGNVSNYAFILEDNEIAVFAPGERPATWMKRSLILPQGYRAFLGEKVGNPICLEKRNQAIILRRCE
jgi:hypothetical protein